MDVLWNICIIFFFFIHLVSSNALKSKRNSSPEGRVSFRECNLSLGERENCGYYGISEQECYSRGCCWGQTQETGVAWCYHSIPTMLPECVMDVTERVECGSNGIRKESCLAKKCCWRPTNEPEAPWCFHKMRVPVFTGECGVPAINPNVLSAARIVGGVEAKPHSWPWQISLRRDGRHWCGGSLISEQWVLSASHCGRDWEYTENRVVLGSHRHSEHDTYEVEMEVMEKIDHPDFDMGTISNDAMLLKLASPLNFTDGLSPVCLPEPGDYTPGRRCYITGWGTLEFMGEAPDVLQQVMMPLIDRDVCNAPDWYGGRVNNGMVCLGYEEGGRAVCNGDSGGPCACFNQDSERWEVVGASSWSGKPCGTPKQPGVYVNIANYVTWIEDTIAAN